MISDHNYSGKMTINLLVTSRVMPGVGDDEGGPVRYHLDYITNYQKLMANNEHNRDHNRRRRFFCYICCSGFFDEMSLKDHVMSCRAGDTMLLFPSPTERKVYEAGLKSFPTQVLEIAGLNIRGSGRAALYGSLNVHLFFFFFQAFCTWDLECSKSRDDRVFFGKKTTESYKLNSFLCTWQWKFAIHAVDSGFPSLLPRAIFSKQHVIEHFLEILQTEAYYIQALIRRKSCPINSVSPEQLVKIEKANICGNCGKYLQKDFKALHHCKIAG